VVTPLERAFFWTSDRLHGLGNSVYYRVVGGDRRPIFFDARETYPELLAIDRNFDTIRAELEDILVERGGIPRYHEIDGTQKLISTTSEDKAWRAFFVHLHWAGDLLPTRARCPRTSAIVESIPGALQAFFSILEPGTPVPEHNGPGLHYLRYHTAFRVPREKPPTIRVRDQRYTWKEGESILFDDFWNHEVFNESEEVRVVLVVDVLRPLPFPLNVYNRFLRWMRIPRGELRRVVIERVGAGGPAALEVTQGK